MPYKVKTENRPILLKRYKKERNILKINFNIFRQFFNSRVLIRTLGLKPDRVAASRPDRHQNKILAYVRSAILFHQKSLALVFSGYSDQIYGRLCVESVLVYKSILENSSYSSPPLIFQSVCKIYSLFCKYFVIILNDIYPAMSSEKINKIRGSQTIISLIINNISLI